MIRLSASFHVTAIVPEEPDACDHRVENAHPHIAIIHTQHKRDQHRNTCNIRVEEKRRFCAGVIQPRPCSDAPGKNPSGQAEQHQGTPRHGGNWHWLNMPLSSHAVRLKRMGQPEM